MDYKELIEQLRFFSQSTANEHIISCLYANAAAAIETLLAEREAAGWISVEDKLPEAETKVLILVNHGEIITKQKKILAFPHSKCDALICDGAVQEFNGRWPLRGCGFCSCGCGRSF